MNNITIFFDLDGTLIDSSTDVLQAFTDAFSENNITKYNINKYYIGPPAIEVIKKAVPYLDDHRAEQVLKSFRKIHDNLNFVNTTLMDSATDTLIELSKKNIRCCLATNKPREGVVRILGKMNLSEYFHEIICLNDNNVPNKKTGISNIIDKYNIQIKNCWFISDNISDIVAGYELGINTVAYLSGYSEVEELKKVNPNYTIDSLIDILKILPLR